jgi:hypothetical protein
MSLGTVLLHISPPILANLPLSVTYLTTHLPTMLATNINSPKFVGIRKEAIYTVPHAVYSMLSMFCYQEIQELHVQKICEKEQG